MRAVSEYGSPGYNLDQVRAGPAGFRAFADGALIQTYGLELEPVGAAAPKSEGQCHVTEGGVVELADGGVLVRGERGVGSTLTLSRFGDPPGFELGTLPLKGWARLQIPTDPATEPWTASVGDESLVTCPLG